jgi:hypothetical protein
MILELDKAECEVLAELLKRRLDEIDIEEHRTKSHYKELLRDEHAVLDRLCSKLAGPGVEAAGVVAK